MFELVICQCNTCWIRFFAIHLQLFIYSLRPLTPRMLVFNFFLDEISGWLFHLIIRSPLYHRTASTLTMAKGALYLVATNITIARTRSISVSFSQCANFEAFYEILRLVSTSHIHAHTFSTALFSQEVEPDFNALVFSVYYEVILKVFLVTQNLFLFNILFSAGEGVVAEKSYVQQKLLLHLPVRCSRRHSCKHVLHNHYNMSYTERWLSLLTQWRRVWIYRNHPHACSSSIWCCCSLKFHFLRSECRFWPSHDDAGTDFVVGDSRRQLKNSGCGDNWSHVINFKTIN